MLIYLDIKIPHLQIAHQGGNLEVGNIKIHQKITMVTQWTHPLTVDLNHNFRLPVLSYTLWMKMISYIVLIMSLEYYWCALSTYRPKGVWKTLVCLKREILRCSLIAMNRLQNCESLLVFPSWTFNRWGARRSNRLDSKTDLSPLMWIWGSPRIQLISISKSLLNH